MIHSRFGRSCIGLLVGLALGPEPAQAQFEPPPTPRPGRSWAFGWTIRPVFTNAFSYENVGGRETLETRVDLALAGTASLGWMRSRAFSHYSADAWASESFFFRDRSLGDPHFGVSLGAERRLTPSVRASGHASLSNGFNFESFYFSQSQGSISNLFARTFTGDAKLAHQLSPRTTLAAGFDSMVFRYRAARSFDYGPLHADSQLPPELRQPPAPDPGEGVVPPAPDPTLRALGFLGPEGLQTNTDYSSWRVGPELQHQLSARNRLSFSTGYRWSETRQLVNSETDQVDAQLGLDHTLNPRNTLGGSYGVQFSHYEARYVNHTLQFRGERVQSSRLTLTGSIGASYLDGPTRERSNWTAIGGAGFSLRLRRTSLTLRYDHNRYQGLATGRHYTSDFGFFLLRSQLARRLSVAAYGYLLGTGDSVDPLGSYRSYQLGVSTGTRAWKRLVVGASVILSRFEWRDVPSNGRPLLSVYLTWR